MNAKSGNGALRPSDKGFNVLCEPAVPYLFFHLKSEDCTITVPPVAAANAGDLPFMARLCGNVLAPSVQCTVCLEEFANCSTAQGGCAALSSGVLPCCHPICSTCLKSLFPLNTKGCTCPTCRVEYPTFYLAPHGSKGGVVLAEALTFGK